MRTFFTLSSFLLLFLFISCDSKDKTSEISKPSVFYTCAMHPQIKEDGPGRCPICHMTLTKIEAEDEGLVHDDHLTDQETEDLWNCRDYPDVTSLKEDICPIDGTQMIQHGSQSSPQTIMAEVRLRKSQITHFFPAIVPVLSKRLESRVRLLGSIVQSEEGEAYIPARVDGRVEKVYVRSTGSFIQKGDPVVDIYSPQLITGGEEYLLARRNVERGGQEKSNAQILLDQTRERLKLWGILTSQMEDWYRSNSIPREITLYSPTTGIVRERKAVEGRYFKAGENLFSLSDLSRVWVEIDVYEQDSSLIKHGQKLSLNFSALPGKIVESEIDFVSPVLDTKTRTLKVRATIDNLSGELKPGMVADVTLVLEHPKKTLVVPRTAIIDTGKRKVAWIKRGENMYQAFSVQTGFESQGYTEVLNGLSEGDLVVIEGNFLLDAQAQLFGGYEDALAPAHNH